MISRLFGILSAFFLSALLAPASAQTTAEQSKLSAIILGSGSPQYNPDRAGPSVLITYGDTKIIVDTGNGAQASLNKANVPIRDLDGLFFTHHHLDHNEEFIPIFIRSLLGGNAFQLAGPAPMTAMIESTLTLYKDDIEYRMRRSGRTLADVQGNYAIKELVGGESWTVGDIKITTAKVNHTIATTAYRFDAGGQSIVISGDLVYSASLSELAKDADYLIIDSGGTIRSGGTQRRGQGQQQGQRRGQDQAGQVRAGRGQAGGQRGRGGNGGGRERAHVTLEETARMASEAGVKNLVMTHFTAGEIDETATTTELRKGFSGAIIFAEDLMQLPENGKKLYSGSNR